MRVSVTSARPKGGRLAVPLKMQSDIRSARSDLWLCSPRTHEMASTILDLPQPFGPMMQVSPAPLKVICVFSQNDLNPTSSTLRSLSKISPFMVSAVYAWVVRLSKIAYTKPITYISAETYSAYLGGF